MKSTFTSTLSIGVIALVLVGFYVYSILYVPIQQAHATSGIAVTQMKNGGTLCGNASSTLMVATSTSGRNLLYISNDSPVSITLNLGKDVASSTGVLLAASTTMRMDATGSYAGAIYCMGIGGNASTTWADSQN